MREDRRIVTNPAAALLLGIRRGEFRGGDVSGLAPSFIFERFELGLSSSSLTSTFWPLASLPGASAAESRPTGPGESRAAGSGCRAWG